MSSVPKAILAVRMLYSKRVPYHLGELLERFYVFKSVKKCDAALGDEFTRHFLDKRSQGENEMPENRQSTK